MTIETLAKQGTNHTGMAGLDTAKLKAMRNAGLRACFQRLDETRYRQEFVARILDREYINDAGARTVNATWYALESTQGGLVWIVCGTEAATDYSRLVPVVLRKVRMMIVLGPAGQLKQAFNGVVPVIEECHSMRDALHKAYLYDATDVKVLFSPACNDGTPTSALGEAFRSEVNEL